MSVANPTFSQIRAQVAAIRKKLPQARTIGIRSTSRWTGECLNRDGADTYLIQQCDSPLALRMALRASVDEQTTKVLLTPLDDAELSDDIRVRLAKRTLFQIDAWQIVRTVFQAQAVDPRLTRHGWLADALLEAVPGEGYPAARNAFLDAEMVWPLLLGQKLGLSGDSADLTALLRWSSAPEALGAWRHESDQFRRAATDWLTEQSGPVAELVLSTMAGWTQPDAVPIGLAAGVLFHQAAGGSLNKAIGKLEGLYLGNQSPSTDLMQSWAAAATEFVRAIRHSDTERTRHILARADDLLQELGAADFAHLSNTSPTGFNQRLAKFGQHLAEVVQHKAWGALGQLADARDAIRAHDHAARDSRRLERAEMALRLVRWLAAQGQAGPGPRSLAEAAENHLTDGGFVDWARLTLRAGDAVDTLSEAYARLFAAVTEVRERQAEQFARLLVDWTAAGSQGADVLPVERVLMEVVAAVAAERAVLVVVVDGMSVAVARELLEDLLHKAWLPLAEPGRPHNRAGIAALPSVTEFSRTSLLCGKLQPGNAEIEKSGFAEHPALLKHSRANNPPILFHKASLQKAEDSGLARDFREAMIPGNEKQDPSPRPRSRQTNNRMWTQGPVLFRWRADLELIPAAVNQARPAMRVRPQGDTTAHDSKPREAVPRADLTHHNTGHTGMHRVRSRAECAAWVAFRRQERKVSARLGGECRSLVSSGNGRSRCWRCTGATICIPATQAMEQRCGHFQSRQRPDCGRQRAIPSAVGDAFDRHGLRELSTCDAAWTCW